MNVAYLLVFLALMTLVMAAWGVKAGNRPSVVVYLLMSLVFVSSAVALYPVHEAYLAEKQQAIESARLELELKRIQGVSAAFGSPHAAAEYLKTH
jgi:hypothetical protein